MKMEERRRYPRVNISFPVECEILPERKKIFYTVTKNLSIGGAKILSEFFFPNEKTFKININLINEIIKAKAKVVWCNKEPYSERYQMGLCFLDMNKNDKDHLKTFLEKIYPS